MEKISHGMNIEPLNSMEQQSVNTELFNLYSIQQCGQSTRSDSNTITLTDEEDNAIQDVCGYVARLLKCKKIFSIDGYFQM